MTRMCRPISMVAFLIFLFLSVCASQNPLHMDITHVDFTAISNMDNTQALAAVNALVTMGAIQIVNIPDFDTTRRNDMDSLAKCLRTENIFPDESMKLTAEAQRLPSQCSESASKLINLVSKSVNILLESLDSLLQNSIQKTNPRYTPVEGPYTSFSDLIIKGDHSEQFYKYCALLNVTDTKYYFPKLNVNINPGLFVAMTSAYDPEGPGLSAQASNTNGDSGLYVKTPAGLLAKARYREDALVLVVGAEGAKWLSTAYGTSFRAAPHVLTAAGLKEPGSSRTVYVQTFFPPDDAVVKAASGLTYSQYRSMAQDSGSSSSRETPEDMMNMPMPSMSNMSSTSGYCFGTGVVMYMSGFQSSSLTTTNCLNLWFQHWTINSALKMGFAWFGIFVLAILLQYLQRFRTSLRNFAMSQPVFFATYLGTLIYGVQTVLSYSMMLITMSMNVELFTAVCVGLMFGYYFFLIVPVRSVTEKSKCVGSDGDSDSDCQRVRDRRSVFNPSRLHM